jgi:hypothetical protein
MLHQLIMKAPKKAHLVSCLVFGMFVSGQAAVEYIIPLQAKEQKIGNMLQWSTASEINSHNFVIEKSIDGVEFTNIGVLEAAGMSGEKKGYRFLDMGMNEERALYRLKQIDLDGMYDYSQTVMVNRNEPNLFAVVAMSRTSFDQTFQVTLDVLADASLDFTISDMEGNVIRQITKEIAYGLNDIEFDLSDEKEGIYKIAIQLKDEKEYLIVQKSDKGEKEANPVASKRKESGG